jgi:hypothetical protein
VSQRVMIDFYDRSLIPRGIFLIDGSGQRSPLGTDSGRRSVVFCGDGGHCPWARNSPSLPLFLAAPFAQSLCSASLFADASSATFCRSYQSAVVVGFTENGSIYTKMWSEAQAQRRI